MTLKDSAASLPESHSVAPGVETLKTAECVDCSAQIRCEEWVETPRCAPCYFIHRGYEREQAILADLTRTRAQIAQVEQRYEALKGYVQHKPDCQSRERYCPCTHCQGVKRACTCGLATLLPPESK